MKKTLTALLTAATIACTPIETKTPQASLNSFESTVNACLESPDFRSRIGTDVGASVVSSARQRAMSPFGPRYVGSDKDGAPIEYFITPREGNLDVTDSINSSGVTDSILIKYARTRLLIDSLVEAEKKGSSDRMIGARIALLEESARIDTIRTHSRARNVYVLDADCAVAPAVIQPNVDGLSYAFVRNRHQHLQQESYLIVLKAAPVVSTKY